MFMILTLIDTKLMASVITCPVRDCLKNTLPSCDSRHITFPGKIPFAEAKTLYPLTLRHEILQSFYYADRSTIVCVMREKFCGLRISKRN